LGATRPKPGGLLICKKLPSTPCERGAGDDDKSTVTPAAPRKRRGNA